jgi:hypothetical protein
MSRDVSRDVFTVCPACGYRCDSGSQIGGVAPGRPSDGDASICLRCGTVSVFAADQSDGLRAPTDGELVELMADERVIAAITGIRLMNRTGGGVPWDR